MKNIVLLVITAGYNELATGRVCSENMLIHNNQAALLLVDGDMVIEKSPLGVGRVVTKLVLILVLTRIMAPM